MKAIRRLPFVLVIVAALAGASTLAGCTTPGPVAAYQNCLSCGFKVP